MMDEEKQGDSGVRGLYAVAHALAVPVEFQQLQRACVVMPGRVPDEVLLRVARDMGLRVRRRTGMTAEEIGRIPCPCMVKRADGTFTVQLPPQHTDPLAAILQPGGVGTAGQDTARRAAGAMPDGAGVASQAGAAAMQTEAASAAGDASTQGGVAAATGEVFLFTRRYEQAQRERRRFGVRWFLPVIRQYGSLLQGVLLLSLLVQLLGLAAPLFMQVIIDKVLVHRSVDTLDILLLGLLLTNVFQYGFQALRSYVFTNVASKMDVMLGSRIFRAVTQLRLGFFSRWQAGDVLARMGEVENLRRFLTDQCLTSVLDLVFSLLYLGVLIVYSRLLSLVVAGFLLVFVVLNVAAAPLYRQRINARFQAGADRRSFLIEALTGIETIKSCGVEHRTVQHYEDLLARYVQRAFGVIKLANVVGSIGLFLQQAFSLAILWVGAMLVMRGELSVGGLIAFQMLAGQMLAPVMRLVDAWQYFQQARVSLARLGDIMDEPGESGMAGTDGSAEGPGASGLGLSRTTLPALQGDIVFEHVSFRYREGIRQVLRDRSFHIRAGEIVGITGPSGAGKSTLIRLLQRFYLPETGRILIDGIDLAQVDPAWLRRQIGVVPQESMLFAGSIAENIRIANPNASDAAVQRAARLAGADDFIHEFPQGYDTPVGENGGLLSGGQRQRVAIARALLNNPRILIFDEATSALDAATEAGIMQSLPQIARGRTTIIVAHRPSALHHAHRILKVGASA